MTRNSTAHWSRVWQEVGPPWTAQAFAYEAVGPSQIPLESLGLEGAQYHTRLNLDSTKSTFFPVPMLLWQPQKSAALSLDFRSRGRVMLAKDFQMLLFEAKPPFPIPKDCTQSFVQLCPQPGQDALLSCALGLFSLSCIPTVRTGPGWLSPAARGWGEIQRTLS